MFGMLLCFFVPGILVGALINQSIHESRKKARNAKRTRAQVQEKRLYICDVEADLRPTRKEQRAA